MELALGKVRLKFKGSLDFIGRSSVSNKAKLSFRAGVFESIADYVPSR